jgi:hypothetical protein
VAIFRKPDDIGNAFTEQSVGSELQCLSFYFSRHHRTRGQCQQQE